MIKHVFVNFKQEKPIVVISDTAESNDNDFSYCGLQELTDEQIQFPEYTVNGIQVDIRAKREFEDNDLAFNVKKKKNEIIQKGNELIQEGVIFKNKRFQIDEQSLVRMSLFCNSSTRWRDIDNNWNELTNGEMRSLFNASKDRVKFIFDKSREMIDSLETKTLDEIKNYKIEY